MSMLRRTILVFSLIQITYAQVEQSQESADGTVKIGNKPVGGFKEGAVVTLKCNGPAGDDLEWVHTSVIGDRTLSSEESEEEETPYVIDHVHTADNSVTYLTIEGLTEDEVGVYTCRSETDHANSDMVTVSIDVHSSEVEQSQESADGTVTIVTKPVGGFKEGAVVILKCNGPAGDDLEWVFTSVIGDIMLSSEESEEEDGTPYVIDHVHTADNSVTYLAIEGLTEEEMGVYTCRSETDNVNSDTVMVSTDDHSAEAAPDTTTATTTPSVSVTRTTNTPFIPYLDSSTLYASTIPAATAASNQVVIASSAAAVGGIVVTALIAVTVYLCRRKSNNKTRRKVDRNLELTPTVHGMNVTPSATKECAGTTKPPARDIHNNHYIVISDEYFYGGTKQRSMNVYETIPETDVPRVHPAPPAADVTDVKSPYLQPMPPTSLRQPSRLVDQGTRPTHPLYLQLVDEPHHQPPVHANIDIESSYLHIPPPTRSHQLATYVNQNIKPSTHSDTPPTRSIPSSKKEKDYHQSHATH